MTEESSILAIGWADWTPQSEPDDDPQSWKVEPGTIPPVWFWNALVNVDVTPWPEPDLGALDWGRDIMVVSTGKMFPVGSTITKADLSPPTGEN